MLQINQSSQVNQSPEPSGTGFQIELVGWATGDSINEIVTSTYKYTEVPYVVASEDRPIVAIGPSRIIAR